MRYYSHHNRRNIHLRNLHRFFKFSKTGKYAGKRIRFHRRLTRNK